MTQIRRARGAPKPEGAAALIVAAQRVGFGIGSRIAPGIARRWAMHLFCTPPRHPHPPVEKEWLQRSRRFEITARGSRVAAWEWGGSGGKSGGKSGGSGEKTGEETRVESGGERAGDDKKYVLLVHGWGGRGSQLWAFVQPLLDAGYAVVTFDAPAHGFSGSRYASVLHFAQAMQAVVDAVGGVHGIVAHSLGGAAANLALARGWIEAARVVTIAAPTEFDSFSRRFARQLNVSDKVRDAMQHHLERRFGYRWQDFEGGRLASANAMPALIIHDRGDKEVSFSDAEHLAAHWPGAHLLPTDKLGHRRILRDAFVVARSVEFMES